MEKKYDLMVFGEPMIQYAIENGDVSTAELKNPSVGGSDIFVAATVAAHGFSSGLYSVIGKDPYENLIRSSLEKHKINMEYCSSAVGFNGIEIVCDKDNDRREFFYNRPAAFEDADAVCPRVNKELIEDCKMIYASSAFTLSSPNARSLVFESFHHAHYNGVSVAFDPNIRLHRHQLPQLRETIWMLLPFIDIFSITAASGEMQAIFGKENPVDVMYDLLEKDVQYAIIRNGGESVICGYKDERTRKNAPPKFVDVNKLENGYFSYSGAVFNGAFCSAILNEATPAEAAEYAARCATQKCRLGNTLDKFISAGNK
ncbi:MAG: PfkB family carbohydrate kinase [Chitinivibrionia bacterium]|nr:PfkB family carbohydrate kinase [Chitinivibrionia bacterium]